MSLWCSSENLSNQWFASNHELWAKHIDFEVRLRRPASQHRKFFFEWHDFEVFGIQPQSQDELFVAVPLWWNYYEASRLLYIPYPLVFTYLSGIYKHCSSEASRISMISRIENLFMTLACFVAACCDGYLSHEFRCSPFDRHHGEFIAPLMKDISADLDNVRQYGIICRVGFAPVLSILALRRSLAVN